MKVAVAVATAMIAKTALVDRLNATAEVAMAEVVAC
jgi:hypothetical protein